MRRPVQQHSTQRPPFPSVDVGSSPIAAVSPSRPTRPTTKAPFRSSLLLLNEPQSASPSPNPPPPRTFSPRTLPPRTPPPSFALVRSTLRPKERPRNIGGFPTSPVTPVTPVTPAPQSNKPLRVSPRPEEQLFDNIRSQVRSTALPIIATTAEPNRKNIAFINNRHRITTPRPKPTAAAAAFVDDNDEVEYEYYYEYYYDDDYDAKDTRKPVKTIDDYDLVPLTNKVKFKTYISNEDLLICHCIVHTYNSINTVDIG